MEGIAEAALSVIEGAAGRSGAEPGDRMGADGLLVCGTCGMRKEKRITIPGSLCGGSGRETVVPVMCECGKRRLEEERARIEAEDERRRLDALRRSSLMDDRYGAATFSNFKRTEENGRILDLAVRYCERFGEMLEKCQGLLLYGPVGTGKSYAAACIANELLGRGVTVVMTSFVKILQSVRGPDVDEDDFMARLNVPKLLIIDDLGAERGTDYALEKVYGVIDGRYRSGKPLILTTNMTLKEMQETTDVRYGRIYDRIFEMCYPVRARGRSWREREAEARFDRMRAMVEG